MSDRMKVLAGCLVVVAIAGCMTGVLMLIASSAHAEEQRQKFIAIFGVEPTGDHNHVGVVVPAHLNDLDSLCGQELSSLWRVNETSCMHTNLHVPLNLNDNTVLYYAARARLAAARNLAKQFGYLSNLSGSRQ